MFESIKDMIKRNKETCIDSRHTHYKPIQRKLPEIKIVGNFDKEDIDEAYDAIVSFLVEKIFGSHDCHVFKYKGTTYIRMKPNPDGTIRDAYSRENDDKYKKKKKKKKMKKKDGK